MLCFLSNIQLITMWYIMRGNCFYYSVWFDVLPAAQRAQQVPWSDIWFGAEQEQRSVCSRRGTCDTEQYYLLTAEPCLVEGTAKAPESSHQVDDGCFS